uniref:uncharacterized protein LOC111501472 n=1 Tax=Maylandia zebra TaxID=106582 RepID=UPI000D326755|nr:uncharacterized protein LOC111501472 [Maylandia zebra]
MDKEHNHPWLNNAGYRYVYNRVHTEDNHTGCYVCSHLPTTAMQATLYGKSPSLSEALCIFYKATSRTCSPEDIFFFKVELKRQVTKPDLPRCNGTLINYTTNEVVFCTPEVSDWNYSCDDRYWVHLNATNDKGKSFNVRREPGIQHPMCFTFAYGNRKLGMNHNCSQTFRMPQDRKARISFLNGTYWVQGTAWACGSKTYFTIPPNSTGLCAPILVSDHTFRVFHQDQPRRRRSTDDVQPHDPIWGSDVPAEFKLWTTRQKVLH